MLFLRKFLKLPSPVDLGWSEYNALPSKDWTPNCAGPTWEDWHVEVKKRHPIKYWIAETASDFLRFKIWFPIKKPFSKAYYWLTSHLIPSRRYHMLDLRQPGGYQYGWQDVDSRMLYAMFNLLKEYFKEEPYDLSKDYSIEEINADPGRKTQYEHLQEAKAILHWWEVSRIEDAKARDDLLHQWSKLRKATKALPGSDETVDKMWAVLQNAEQDDDKKEDEMIARLMKIRRTLWT